MYNQNELMEDERVEINVYCGSEKESVGIGFGSSVESVEVFFKNYDDFDIETMQESFWENYHEFEEGIEKAKAIKKCNKQFTLRQALFEVFGHFHVFVQVNEEEIEPEITFADEIEEIMYSMLELVVE